MKGSIPVFVGLDYGNQAVQVAVLDQAGRLCGSRRVSNSMTALTSYVDRFGQVLRAAWAGKNSALLTDTS